MPTTQSTNVDNCGGRETGALVSYSRAICNPKLMFTGKKCVWFWHLTRQCLARTFRCAKDVRRLSVRVCQPAMDGWVSRVSGGCAEQTTCNHTLKHIIKIYCIAIIVIICRMNGVCRMVYVALTRNHRRHEIVAERNTKLPWKYILLFMLFAHRAHTAWSKRTSQPCTGVRISRNTQTHLRCG